MGGVLLILAYLVGLPLIMLAWALLPWLVKDSQQAIGVAVIHLVVSAAAILAIFFWLVDYKIVWFASVPGIVSAAARLLLEIKGERRNVQQP